MISSTIYACLLLLALFFALGRGAKSERDLGLVLLAGNLGTIAVLVVTKASEFTYVPLAYLGVDVLAALVLCALAIKNPTWMAVLIATFQINGTLGHAVKLVSPDTFNVSYAILLRLWAWPMVLTLLLAHWKPSMRALLRQSDLEKLPPLLRPSPSGFRPAQAPSTAVTAGRTVQSGDGEIDRQLDGRDRRTQTAKSRRAA